MEGQELREWLSVIMRGGGNGEMSWGSFIVVQAHISAVILTN